MEIRKATLRDADLLVRLRLDYLAADHGPLAEEMVAAIAGQFRAYLAAHLPAGDFMAFIAEEGGAATAAAFLLVREMPATPDAPNGRSGYALNVLTYPAHRKKGYATAILRTLIDEAKRLGLSKVELAATSDGKPVYEKIGFAPVRHTHMKLAFHDGVS